MNISKEQIDELNAVLTVELSTDDYQGRVNDALKNYGKNVSLPGFRPGKVPAGIVKKRYGKAILAEEINKILNDAVQDHIRENDIKILGGPLAKANGEEGDWDNPADFKFEYELGLAPEFEVKLSKREKYVFNKVLIDDTMVERQANDLAKRYGKMESVDVAGENDMLVADIIELDENDAILEGGFMQTSTVSIEFLTNDDAKKELIGKKVGDTVIISPKAISRGEADMAAMLGITKEQALTVINNVQLNIKEVKRLSPADINQELFDKLFGEGKITSEEEFKAHVREDLEKGFASDADRLFQKTVSEKLTKKLDLNLPDDFLKRWIKATNEKPISDEQLEGEYPQYAQSLKWQLISNTIIESSEIKVELDEVKEHIKGLFIQQYAQYGIPAPEASALEANVNQVLANQEEARKIFDQLYNQKLIQHIKESVKVEDNEVPFDEFVKLASN